MQMDVVKLWSSLLANCAIGPTACTIPTAYFVQGTADVQFLGYANPGNDNVVTENNNETFSIADSDSNSSCYDKRQEDVITLEADVGDDEQDEEGEEEQDEDDDDDEEDEEDEDNQLDQHLVPVKIVDELVDGTGSECVQENDVRLIEVGASAIETGDKQRKLTQGKQTQTKIHRNRYSREEYRCSMCPYTCTTEKAFLKHSRNCEPKDQSDHKQLNLSCPICGKDRKGEESLALHMKKHKDNKHFCCDICKFKTLQLKKLIQHRRMHTGEKPHLCPFCSYRSARRDNLRSHARRVHKKDNLPCDTFTPRSMILRPSKSK